MPANYHLKLYIAGDSVRSRLTVENVRKVCTRLPKGHCKVDVIDLRKEPEIAIQDQIFAIPTLIIASYDSTHQYIGDFASTDKVLQLLK